MYIPLNSSWGDDGGLCLFEVKVLLRNPCFAWVSVGCASVSCWWRKVFGNAILLLSIWYLDSGSWAIKLLRLITISLRSIRTIQFLSWWWGRFPRRSKVPFYRPWLFYWTSHVLFGSPSWRDWWRKRGLARSRFIHRNRGWSIRPFWCGSLSRDCSHCCCWSDAIWARVLAGLLWIWWPVRSECTSVGWWLGISVRAAWKVGSDWDFRRHVRIFKHLF